MADDASPSPAHRLAPAALGPDPRQLVHYIEKMLLELAEMASTAGETALAASLALTAIQAGAAGDRAVRDKPA